MLEEEIIQTSQKSTEGKKNLCRENDDKTSKDEPKSIQSSKPDKNEPKKREIKNTKKIQDYNTHRVAYQYKHSVKHRNEFYVVTIAIKTVTTGVTEPR